MVRYRVFFSIFTALNNGLQFGGLNFNKNVGAQRRCSGYSSDV